jgi:hypothetical protein
MEQKLSAHQFMEVYQNLGISLNKLGCIMADTEPLVVSDIISPEDLYTAVNPAEHAYVNGIVSEDVPHATLLYGLLRSGPELQKHVDAVLTGWNLGQVEIANVVAWPSRYEDEQYYCLVAELALTPELLEANARLRMLPHIDTFPAYRAHITLAYIKQDDEKRDQYLDLLRQRFVGQTVAVKSLNYGD